MMLLLVGIWVYFFIKKLNRLIRNYQNVTIALHLFFFEKTYFFYI
jgi:hypothetical protein